MHDLKVGIPILLALCMTSLVLGTFWHQLSVIDQGVHVLNAQMKHTVQALTQQLQVCCVRCVRCAATDLPFQAKDDSAKVLDSRLWKLQSDSAQLVETVRSKDAELQRMWDKLRVGERISTVAADRGCTGFAGQRPGDATLKRQTERATDIILQ